MRGRRVKEYGEEGRGGKGVFKQSDIIAFSRQPASGRIFAVCTKMYMLFLFEADGAKAKHVKAAEA